MPRLSAPEKATSKVEFVLSVPLDLLNAMYFTHLVVDAEGVEGWPAQVRQEMDPELLAELDFLFTFPKGQPGLMGFFGDHLWAHPETWTDIDSLLDYLRRLPAGMGKSETDPGIQRFAFYSTCWNANEPDIEPEETPRETLVRMLEGIEADVESSLAFFDDPEGARSRMIRLIERFRDEHYKPDMPRRLPILERAYEAARSLTYDDPVELAKRLSGRSNSCLGGVCSGPFDKLYFAPSIDMGPYVSCSCLNRVHGLVFPANANEEGDESAADTVRLARIYKALGDEQRLAILHMLQDGEMYIGEIVDRTGLHQSVVSRHLSFMHAVGILQKRRDGSMKFVSINPEMREVLSQTIELFSSRSPTPAGGAKADVAGQGG